MIDKRDEAETGDIAAGMLALDAQLCFAVYSAAHALNRTYKPLLDPYGLTYPQYIALMTLWEEDGRTVKALGETLGPIILQFGYLNQRMMGGQGEFLERLAPAYLHIFPFSERPGTPAVDFPDKVQPSVATRRVEELEELCRRLHGEFCARAEGTTDEVLFESTMRGGMMFGYTGNYRRVKAPYDRSRINTICRVRLGRMDDANDLEGEIVDN